MKKRRQRGQVIAEYAIMLVLCALIAGALLTLFGAFTTYGDRLMRIVRVDYP